jgi:hypothetical protein
MKLVTFERSGERHIGALLADGITLCDFTATKPAVPHFRDMLALIDGGPVALDQAGELVRGPGDRVRLAEVRVLAPVPEPRSDARFSLLRTAYKASPFEPLSVRTGREAGSGHD